MDIFVINMERATERREQILAHLRDLGLKAEILPAVEGARVPPEALPPGTHPDLSAGEIGCYLSHVHFWETVVARGLNHAIVHERRALQPESDGYRAPGAGQRGSL